MIPFALQKWKTNLFLILLLCRSTNSFFVLDHLRRPRRPCKSTAALATDTSSSFREGVQVYDNVFSSEVCEELHYLALDHSDRCGVRSTIFHWNEDEDNLLTPLEQAIKSCLQQLPLPSGNLTDSLIVEYWSRDEYLNMDTHADIDERELLNEGNLRCPDYGHVLYLEVDPNIRGPTCVFSRYGGWNENQQTNTVSMVTVPAVSGRVLRFPGSAMHAVPKPSTLWFLEEEEQTKILEEEEMEDAWDEDDLVERSVILFNVWMNRGPMGVPEDLDAKGKLPDGIGLIEEDSDSYIDRQKEERRAFWNEEYGKDCSSLWCNPRRIWEEIAVVETSDQNLCEKIQVPLMGNKARRLYPHKHVCLNSPDALAGALQNDRAPFHFTLKWDPNKD